MSSFMNSALPLRRRSVWEAVDSGILLWRSNFFYLIPFFALPVWIAACALRLLPNEFTWVSYLALWWLKPFFDRLVLHVVSRRFFGSAADQGNEDFSPPSRLKEIRVGLWGSIRRGLLGDLLWRRFSPARSARMPIRILERTNRRQYKLRKSALAAGGLNFCFPITMIGMVMEGMLLFGEIIFTIVMTQMFFPTVYDYLQLNFEILELLLFAAFCVNYILVESLYVCMGFGLYINSRVEVEGWDLQLLFQKFAYKANKTKTVSLTGLPLVLLVCAFLALAPSAHAEDEEDVAFRSEKFIEVDGQLLPASEKDREPIEYFPESFPYASEQSLLDLEAILESLEFGGFTKGWGIRFKNEKEKKDLKQPEFDLEPWVEALQIFFSSLLRVLLVLAVAALLFFALFWLWKNKERFRRKGKREMEGRNYASPLFSPESPESLFFKAENFFFMGHYREAWAACLSGCLGVYSGRRALVFPVNATEYGCLDLVRRKLPGEASGFGELVQTWILFAYGGRAPNEGAFEKALSYGRSLLKDPSGGSAEISGGISGGGSDEP